MKACAGRTDRIRDGRGAGESLAPPAVSHPIVLASRRFLQRDADSGARPLSVTSPPAYIPEPRALTRSRFSALARDAWAI